MMEYLSDDMIKEISDQILQTTGYEPEMRQICWAGINFRFRTMQRIFQIEQIQLDTDLQVLNHTARLSDGIIPFEYWLEKMGRYLKPYQEASKLINKALDVIHAEHGVQPALENPTPPPTAVLGEIVKEKTIHQNDMVYFAFLESGFRAGNSVCRVKIPRFEGNSPKLMPDGNPAIYLGTGWLISQELVITNHHVVQARENNEPAATKAEFRSQAEGTVLEFDYNAENMPGSNVAITVLEASDETLDYAIFRIPKQANRQPLRLLPEPVVLGQGGTKIVNIIQHPLGYAKKVALRNNHVYDAPYPAIRYFTDTEGGSSGSPVFNDQWQAIALHRAHRLVDNVIYMGQTTGVVNEGIQIEAIMADLKAKYSAVYKEIAE